MSQYLTIQKHIYEENNEYTKDEWMFNKCCGFVYEFTVELIN